MLLGELHLSAEASLHKLTGKTLRPCICMELFYRDLLLSIFLLIEAAKPQCYRFRGEWSAQNRPLLRRIREILFYADE